MKKRVFLLLAGVVLVFIGVVIGKASNKEDIIMDDKEVSVIKHENSISMMLETEAGSGNYEMTTRDSWPTEGYIFNSNLSKCENGGELSWDDEKKVVLMSGNVSDRCYVYFDVLLKTLVDYVKELYTGTQGEKGLYYHNNSLTNGANDNSYRFGGSNETINNYVCFGSDVTNCPEDNLYRIIGVIDDKVKLVKATSAGKNMLGTDGAYDANFPERYVWSTLSICPRTTAYVKANHNNTVFMARKNEIAAPSPQVGCNKWDYSGLNTKNLNVNFLQSFTLKNISQISDTTWQANSSSTKIGLVSYQDYQFAFSSNYWDLSYDGNYRTNNWLYNSNDLCSHTITPSDSGDITVYLIINDDFYDASYLSGGQHGGQLFEYQSASYCAIYPSFYLNSDVTYKSGTGTISDPIILGD